jgi:hypothetical protein
MDEKQQDQQRRMNTGAHLQRAGKAMELAANTATWEDARSQMKAAAESMRFAAASIMAA